MFLDSSTTAGGADNSVRVVQGAENKRGTGL